MFDFDKNEDVTEVLLTIDEVGPMGGGDMAYERGHYTYYKRDGSIFDYGK